MEVIFVLEAEFSCNEGGCRWSSNGWRGRGGEAPGVV